MLIEGYNICRLLKINLADSMFVIMAVALVGGLLIASMAIYTKVVVMDSKSDIQLEQLKKYNCEEIVKFHATAHYLSTENKQYASQKVESCSKDA